jgi:hypothetical protein
LAAATRVRVEFANASPHTSERTLEGIEVLLYFASPPHSIYQVRQWLRILDELNAIHPTGLLIRDYDTFKALSTKTSLPLIFVHSFRDLSQLVSDADPKVALYVNHSSANYQMLRFSKMLHVHIGHGESEKEYMATNQLKAYDYVFVAAKAGARRIMTSLYRFSADRLVEVGRPQLSRLPYRPTVPPTVLYAPTYEGDISGTNYSSVGELGVQVVQRIVDSNKYAVIYRPHPLTGVNDRSIAAADARVRGIISRAGRPHQIDDSTDLPTLMSQASILIADTSSVVIDWLVQDRPYLVTNIRGDSLSRIHDAGTVLEVSNVGQVVDLIDRALGNDERSDYRQCLANYHLGTGASAGQTSRFLDAVERIVEARDCWTQQLPEIRPPDS